MATAFTAASARRCRLEDSAPASAHLEWAWCRPAGLLDAWLARPLPPVEAYLHTQLPTLFHPLRSPDLVSKGSL